jgi:hypothetical protein
MTKHVCVCRFPGGTGLVARFKTARKSADVASFQQNVCRFIKIASLAITKAEMGA